ncbi:MAG TPA: hypothetical protein VFE05_16140 [Longimicrobiaceae bacterium]|nr:hypothetical protein [Longimicrobiaceae bacterium]
MSTSRRFPARAAAVLGLAAAAVLACTDHSDPLAPVPGGPASPNGPGASPAIELARIECTASVAGKTVECHTPAAAERGVRGDLLYGGQDTFVTVSSANVEYDSGTHKYTVDVRVRNLIAQAIGTTNGTTADPSGVRLFFHQQPTATSGSGTIVIDNADGVGTFTASNQPYNAYVARLDQFVQSAPKTWQFDVPPTVGTFAFQMYVSSPVQFPTGWIDVSHPTYELRRTFSKLMTGVVRDQFGRAIHGAVITWSSGNAALATTAADSGFVTGHLPGAVDIVASSTNTVSGGVTATQTGASHVTVLGTTLTWTAGASSTDWNATGNWDRAVAPVAQDTAVVPVVGSAIYPVLVQNQAISGLAVSDGATIDQNAFDLTASENVAASTAGGTGGITGTTGRLFLTGAGKTATGRLPRLRVSGTYSLTGNVNASAPVRVDGGRMRTTSFRLRIQ